MVSFPLNIKQTHDNKHVTVVSKERTTYNNGLVLLSRKTYEKHRKPKNGDDLADCTVHVQYSIDLTAHLDLNETVIHNAQT